jgi:hypothetical protein
MSPTPQPDEANILTEWAWKIAGTFLAFVGGIVSATLAVASKVRSYDDRLKVVETNQNKCKSETLASLADKLDALPDRIEAKMESRLNRIHDRIDDIIKGQ